MTYNKLINLITVVSFGMAGCGGSKQSLTQSETMPVQEAPANIILMIGDGMGLSQVSAAFYYQQDHTSHFPRFKHIGLINTSSSSHKVTDSAAGATAFACGEKTYNGAIGLNADSAVITNITEVVSEKKKMKTGIVSTSSVTHATPACFYAHVPFRKMEFDIAAQMPGSELDFFAGGGRKFFRGIMNELQAADFITDTTSLPELSNWDADRNKKYGFLLADNGMPKMLEGRGSFLQQSTALALKYLAKSPQGFFLMVEGSQIDWGGHDNDYDYLATELLDFDNTIGDVLDFAEKDGRTLVIVLADHETGGFTLGGKPIQNGDRMSADYSQVEGLFSTGGHSTTLIPVFAYGPGSEHFNGIYQNHEVYHKMIQLLNVKP